MKKLLAAAALLIGLATIAKAEIAPVRGSTATFKRVEISSAANSQAIGKAKFFWEIYGGNQLTLYFTNGSSTNTLFSVSPTSFTWNETLGSISADSVTASTITASSSFTATNASITGGSLSGLSNFSISAGTITTITSNSAVTNTSTGTTLTFSSGTVGAFTAASATIPVAYVSSMTYGPSGGTIFLTTHTAVATDWQVYTPTGPWTTGATYTGLWRRVGDTMEIQCQITTSGGVGVGGSIQCEMPNSLGYVPDSAKMIAAGTQFLPGDAKILDNGTAIIAAFTAGGSATTNSRMNYIVTGNGGILGTVDNNNPIATASGDKYWFHWWIPIVGWKANGGGL